MSVAKYIAGLLLAFLLGIAIMTFYYEQSSANPIMRTSSMSKRPFPSMITHRSSA